MLIEKQYIRELQDLLHQEQFIGNTWVAYTQEPFPDKSIHFFRHEAEAKNFCIAATKSSEESVKKPMYYMRKTEDLTQAVLKEIEFKHKHGASSDLHVIGLPRDYNVEAIAIQGIYLPDLKRVIDDTPWHEYKDLGLNWNNRYESRWWELNGTFTIDQIDRQVLILVEDQRIKNTVEQVIGKGYLGYFDRSLLITDEQRAKIDTLLADYPFRELNDQKRRGEIVAALGKGEVVSMTLEKRFHPEPEIGQYLIFEHLYPEGTVYERGHSVRKLDGFHDFSMALDFLQVNAVKHLEMPSKRVSELTVIGQYHGKELLLDYEGLPESHTGLHIATGWKNGNNLPELFFSHIPHEPIILTQSLFVDLDGETLRLNDGIMDLEIDKSFWKSGHENMNANIGIEREHLRIPFTANLVETYFTAINSNLKYNTMNVEKAQFVKDQVFYQMGRDKQYEADIVKNIQSGVKEFTSKGKYEFYEGERKLDTVLNFKRGNNNEKYHWNSYDATLTSATGLVTKQKYFIDTVWKENEQGRWISKTYGFTPKEGCNLLDSDQMKNSRAVCKEFVNKDGKEYTAWYKLDLNSLEKNKNHPVLRFPEYDIKKVLGEHGVKETLDKVVESVQRGNRQAVFTPEGDVQYFAADPQYKDVFVYDKDLNLIYQNSQRINASQAQEQSNTGEQLSTATNGQQNGVSHVEQSASLSAADKDKEPQLSNGTTNQSQNGNNKGHSNKNNQEVDSDKPLIEKGKGRKSTKKAKDSDEVPSKNAPSRGEGALLGKNSTSKKGMGVK